MTKAPLCIHHHPCADGFMAACVVDRFFGYGNVEFLPANYGDAPPADDMLRGRDVYVVDFSYPEDVLRKMAVAANRVLVLDHHASAAKNLAGVEAPEPSASSPRGYRWPFVDADDPVNPTPVDHTPRAIFDMNRSGAGMAWDFFFAGTKRPRVIDLVEDRDLWRFAYDSSRPFAARLFAEPYDRLLWSQVLEADPEMVSRMVLEGRLLMKKQEKDMLELLGAQNGRIEQIGGYSVPVYNLPYYLVSDALHVACQGYPFAASYWDGPTHRNFSLRSDMKHGGVDVSQVAAEYGGGGHKEAAGFRIARQRGFGAVDC